MSTEAALADEDLAVDLGPSNDVSLPRPLVAIVGRPNVGKSTLFNRLVGAPLAIVQDIPGVTRDRHYAPTSALGRLYMLVDTGGFDPESDDPMTEGIVSHVKIALSECELVICVLDATEEPTEADRQAVDLLRRSSKPVLFVANKTDSRAGRHGTAEHYTLGIDSIMSVSALHGHGLGEVEQWLADHLPEPPEPHDDEVSLSTERMPRLAIVGRPNAGKSSLVNRLLGDNRQLVDDRPGTTVDSIDTVIDLGGKRWVLTDTAGIRRQRAVVRGIESLAVLQAVRAIERSHAALLMIDSKTGPAEQDAKIAGLITERGRAMVVALNKSDLLSREEQRKAIERTKEILAFAGWAPVVSMSATTGRGLKTLLARVERAMTDHSRRIPTAETNRFFEHVLDHHPPPTARGKSVRLFYVTQARVRPPTFVVVTNEPEAVHFSYQRYVVNQIRERFHFEGTPIRVVYRKRGRDR